MAKKCGGRNHRRRQSSLTTRAEGSPAASTPATDGDTDRFLFWGRAASSATTWPASNSGNSRCRAVSTKNDFGTGVSPLLVDGIVVLQRDETQGPQNRRGRLRSPGNPCGRRKRLSPCSYCTPVVWATPTGKQIVTAGYGRMIGYDLKTGKEKWSVAGMPSACCASPVVSDGKLFLRRLVPWRSGRQGFQDAGVRRLPEAGRRGETGVSDEGGTPRRRC